MIERADTIPPQIVDPDLYVATQVLFIRYNFGILTIPEGTDPKNYIEEMARGYSHQIRMARNTTNTAWKRDFIEEIREELEPVAGDDEVRLLQTQEVVDRIQLHFLQT